MSATPPPQPQKKTRRAYERASRPPYSLTLEKKSGDLISYSYSHLTRVLFTHSTSTIMLEFGKQAAVKITGIELEQLARDIARHEVDSIIEDGCNSGTPEIKVAEIKILAASVKA